MKKHLIKFRKIFTEVKVKINRSMSYVSLINSGMILFLLLSRLENYGIDIELKQWFFPILIIGITGLIVVGILDDKLGFFHEEQKNVQKRNPYMKEIIERLDRIEKRLNKK